MLLVVAPPGLALWYISRFGVNAAQWDHLTNAELFDRYYSGLLTIEYLFRPHLEHLKFFPRLICLALGLASGFDNVVEMYFQWLLLCVTAAALFVGLRRRATLPDPRFLIAFALIPFALFNLRQHQSLLVGDGMITYAAIAALTTSIVLLDGAGSLLRVVAATLAAVVASFSHASGLLLWPIGILIIVAPGSLSRGRRLVALPIWLAAGAIVAAVYAWRLPPGTAAPADYAISHAQLAVGYILAASGAAFAVTLEGQTWLGAILLAAETGLLVLTWRAVSKGERVPLGVWLVVFAIGCRLLLAAGRFSGGGGQSVPSRYAAFGSLGVAGLYAAAMELQRRGATVLRSVVTAAAALIVVGGSALGYMEGLRAGPTERDMRIRVSQVLLTTSLQDDPTVVAWLYPNPDHARAYAGSMKHRRLNVFADPLIETAGLPRSGDVEFHIDSIVPGQIPGRSPVTLGPAAVIHLSGWAFEKASKGLLSGVFVQVDRTTLIPAAYGISRPDVARRFPVPGDIGFSAIFDLARLGRGEHTLGLQFVTGDKARVVETEAIATIVVR